MFLISSHIVGRVWKTDKTRKMEQVASLAAGVESIHQPTEKKPLDKEILLYHMLIYPMLIETKERKMSMANVSMLGRMITKTHLRRSKLLFKLS